MALPNSQPTDKSTIKNWFKTGLIPTQEQFWAWMDSFWHKGENIPQSSIEGLAQTLLDIQDNAGGNIDAHLADAEAHADLFNAKADVDTVQEIVDAIESLQDSFSLLLVNDYSGGTTKAATAEIVKNLKGLLDNLATAVAANTSKVTNATHTGDVTGSSVLTIGDKKVTNAKLADMPALSFKGNNANLLGAARDLTVAQAKEMLGLNDFTHQIISTGGNYNNLEITADLVIFTNENAQAVINGIRGKKDFHLLNLSTNYEVKINHNSMSVSGLAKPIKLPTANGSVGVKGTARILYANDDYGYFISDTWGSRYRPEFPNLIEEEIATVNEFSIAGTMKKTEYEVFRDAQTTTMTKAQLNIAYPNASRPFNVICPNINLIYKKINNDTNEWISIPMTAVV